MKEADLVDEYSTDGTGWARFDSTRKHRYRLARAVSLKAKELCGVMSPGAVWNVPFAWLTNEELTRVVFVMLNPSTADAFKPDPTVSKCVQFAALWGADVLEVVNLFSIRTPYPEDVRQLHADDRGGSVTNNAQIIAACERPNVQRVVVAWGNNGKLDDRDMEVRYLIRGYFSEHSIARRLCALKLLGDPRSTPIHPLARGKQFVPLTIIPVPWP